MQDKEFQIKVVRDISEIKTDLKHLMMRLPTTDLEAKVKFNRALIMMLLTGYVGIIAFFFNFAK